mgnify:CR=1 FL=1
MGASEEPREEDTPVEGAADAGNAESAAKDETPETPEEVDAPAPEPEPELDPSFASNLTELPEVFEMPEEQFLSDFAEEEAPAQMDVNFEAEPVVVQSNSDLIDDAFLDSFMDDEGGFDLLDLDEAPLSKINEAQVLIDEGNVEEARRLLQEVIDESDDGPQQTARDLLAGLN